MLGKVNEFSGIQKLAQESKPEFVPPPEAPVFYPNEEEFQDPLAYIAKIRPLVEKTGICKIKPPPNWNPPFAVDVDKFKFTPRVQKLNELDAKTRTKLNFLEKLAKFWELQGTALKIPVIEGKPLDLYTLHKIIHSEGGFVTVTEFGNWSKISRIMGYQSWKNVGILLRNHYQRLLFPFDLFNDQKKDVKYQNAIYRMGPSTSRQEHYHASSPESQSKTRTRKQISGDDLLEQYICHKCNKGDDEEYMLLCDGCDDGYHTFCLIPPLESIPEGDWCCPKCVAEECSKPMDEFGFEQAHREYTLQQFGEMADKFKHQYFKMNTHEVPCHIVEQEYWRIISSIDEDVTVEYGADLHAMDHGSGFPTMASKNLFSIDKEYADSPWNLNNLPVLEGSVLRYITANVSGIKVPWMYVGMCFATFCWHSEDHWTYSINYLHWGEPKTWYAVPGDKAESFEMVMRMAAPELFNSQPDLLHQLVTTLNPNILMNAEVPVFRTDQQAGEFVVTFPRAYHAGFNQGYNFAEAVNFAPADWLKIGRECMLHYSKLRRFCVFSHDELLCKMASDPDKLSVDIATASYQDMLAMVDNEKKMRKHLLDSGVQESVCVFFELKSDDERQCEVCKTTIFLSAVSCKCSPNILLCLRHYRTFCQCSLKYTTLKFRFTLDELHMMLKRLKLKAEYFDDWVAKVKLTLDPNNPRKVFLSDLKELLNQAIIKKYPKEEFFHKINDVVKKGEKFVSIIHQLNIYKERSANSTIKVTRITIDELKVFEKEIKSLPCVLAETKYIEELLNQAEIFEKTSSSLLSEPLDSKQITSLKSCKEFANKIGVELPNFTAIVLRLERLQWLEDVQRFKNLAHVMNIGNIKDLIEEGSRFTPDPILDNELQVLKDLLRRSRAWEKKALNALQSKGNNVLIYAEELFQEASKITCFLPTEGILYDAVQKARGWLKLLEEIRSAQTYPCFAIMENLVQRGKQLTLHLVEVEEMERHLKVATIWKEKVCNLFLKENAKISLLEMLTPRTINRNFLENFAKITTDTSALVTVYKEAEDAEIQMMKNLRELNLHKSLDFFNNHFCICSEKPFGVMRQCELCKDWFHLSCLPETDTISNNCKFLCPNCQRTKRPDKNFVFEQLLALRDLYLRIPEGEVLQCLSERVLKWQAKANQILADLQTHSSWVGENYVLSMNLTMRAQIEEIGMEGDLLEISVEESLTLWNVLQAVQQFEKKPKFINFDSYIQPLEAGSRQNTDQVEILENDDSALHGNQFDVDEIIDVDDDSDIVERNGEDMNYFDDIEQNVEHNYCFSHDSGLGDEGLWSNNK